MKCYACDREINKKGLGYDIRTLKTYCINPEQCKNPAAIPGKLVELKDSSLRTEITENYPEEVAETLNRMIGKVTSARIQPYMAMHIMKTAQENNLHSVNETLLFILERDIEAHGISSDIAGTNFVTKVIPEGVLNVEEVKKAIEPPNKYELYVEGQAPIVYETHIPVKEVEPEPAPIEPEVVEEPKEEEESDTFEF